MVAKRSLSWNGALSQISIKGLLDVVIDCQNGGNMQGKFDSFRFILFLLSVSLHGALFLIVVLALYFEEPSCSI